MKIEDLIVISILHKYNKKMSDKNRLEKNGSADFQKKIDQKFNFCCDKRKISNHKVLRATFLQE